MKMDSPENDARLLRAKREDGNLRGNTSFAQRVECKWHFFTLLHEISVGVSDVSRGSRGFEFIVALTPSRPSEESLVAVAAIRRNEFAESPTASKVMPNSTNENSLLYNKL